MLWHLQPWCCYLLVTQAQHAKQRKLNISYKHLCWHCIALLFWSGMHFWSCCCIFNLTSTPWARMLCQVCTVLLLLMLLLARLTGTVGRKPCFADCHSAF